MNNVVTVETVREYLSSKLGMEIRPDSILPDDLHIDGFDAQTLILDLGKEFNFSLSGFEFKNYFLSERELGNIFLTLFHTMFRRKKSKKLTFTIQHIVDVINNGAWFDPK